MRQYFLCLCIAAAIVVAGCSSSGPSVMPSMSPQSLALAPGQSAQFHATLPGNGSTFAWSVNGVAGGDSTVGTVDSTGKYTAPSNPQSMAVTVTANSGSGMNSSVSAKVYVVAPGTVAQTKNPQVALYTIDPPADAAVTVQFGPTTSYGRSTWTQQTPAGGGAVPTLVAGMLMNSTYHMQATLKFADGVTFSDSDRTFATGTIPPASLPTLTASTTAAMTPQSGVELLDMVTLPPGTSKISIAVTDLNGNILWTYDPGLPALFAGPIKLLPNGHLLVNVAAGVPDGLNSVLQEVDLTGQVIWQMAAPQLNQALAAATCAGCNITVVGTHHDFAVLPNGHVIVIAALQQIVSGVTVTGDVLIDLDQNHKPVWVWNEFDHLDVNRHPMNFPDWTHTNAVVYSPDDKALIVSIRHQDWAIKIDYNDGQGTGNILWKLGFQGDFTLENGTDPVDWFYAQHDVNIASSNSSGTFQLLMFDNGNQRVLDSSGTECGSGTACVSRVPLLQLNENAKTATIQWVDNLAPLFSSFGGSARLLANGNIEFDECAPTTPANNAAIFEVTQTTPAQTVWQMQITGQYAYRGFRIPSLYPGVQW